MSDFDKQHLEKHHAQLSELDRLIRRTSEMPKQAWLQCEYACLKWDYLSATKHPQDTSFHLELQDILQHFNAGIPRLPLSDPKLPSVLFSYGCTLEAQRQLEEALFCFEYILLRHIFTGDAASVPSSAWEKVWDMRHYKIQPCIPFALAQIIPVANATFLLRFMSLPIENFPGVPPPFPGLSTPDRDLRGFLFDNWTSSTLPRAHVESSPRLDQKEFRGQKRELDILSAADDAREWIVVELRVDRATPEKSGEQILRSVMAIHRQTGQMKSMVLADEFDPRIDSSLKVLQVQGALMAHVDDYRIALSFVNV